MTFVSRGVQCKQMKIFSTIAALAAIAGCVMLAGCSRRAEQPAGVRPETSGPAPQEPASLRAVDAKTFAASLAKYRGKAVLVDYWATWCDPCKKLLPHTVALHREMAGQNLAVISVSFDDVEEEPEARTFLADQGADFENLRAATGASSRSFVEFDVANGTLPFMRIYDRAGKVYREFLAPIKPEEIQRAVKELLSMPAS